MGRWELIKNWLEVSFAPYVGQKLYVRQCVCVYVYLLVCVLGRIACVHYTVVQPLFLITSTN